MFSKYNVAFVLRGYNIILLQKSMAFISNLGIPVIPFFETESDTYFREIVYTTDFDYLINIDEDAFVFDHEVLFDLLEFFVHGEYTLCGVADGGHLTIRDRNPFSLNPFFTIIHAAKVREIPYEKFMWGGAAFDLSENKIDWVVPGKNFSLCIYEPYYPFFFAFHKYHLKILYLRAEPWKDGAVPDVLYYNSKPFLIHTWYAREYGKNDIHTATIDEAYDFAKSNALNISQIDSRGVLYKRFKDQLIKTRKYFKIICRQFLMLVKYFVLLTLNVRK